MSDTPTRDELARAVAFAVLTDVGDLDAYASELKSNGIIAVGARWRGTYGTFTIQVGDWQEDRR